MGGVGVKFRLGVRVSPSAARFHSHLLHLQNLPEKDEKELKPEVSITNQTEHGRLPFEDETADEVRTLLKRDQKNKSPQPVQRLPPDEKPLSFR